MVVKTLAKCLREYKKATILTLIFIALEVFVEVLIPFRTADMVNMIKAGEDMQIVLRHGLILVVMALVSMGCGAIAARTCADAASGFARNVRRDLYVKVQEFSFHNIDKFSTASLVTRMTTDVNNVQMTFMMLIRTAIRSPLMFVFAITMAFIMAARWQPPSSWSCRCLYSACLRLPKPQCPLSAQCSESMTSSMNPLRKMSGACAL